jgi:hypothetical protein
VHLGAATVASHPADDRLAQPDAPGLDLVEHEALPRSRTKAVTVRLDLHVHAHLRHAGVARRVVGGLAHSRDEGLEPGVHLTVADDDEVDLDVVAILDLRDDVLERRADRGDVTVTVRRPLVEQPGSSSRS